MKDGLNIGKTNNQKNMDTDKLQKWLIRGLIILVIYIFYHPAGIFVLGDPYSVYRYRKVLNQLEDKMPDNYEMIRDNIDKISINYIITGGNYAGHAHKDSAGNNVIRVLENTFVQGKGYAAATLVHEACHGEQFNKNLPFEPFCENQKREHRCNEMGLEVLRKFEGPKRLIDYYEGISVGEGIYGDSCQTKK